MISYGSCQFPTLGFIVERYRAIEDFVDEKFWKLKVVWEVNEEERVEFLWKRHHLFNETVVQILLEKYYYQNIITSQMCYMLVMFAICC